MAKLCKNCEENEAVQYSKYTTGEFCCKQCARAFATKNDRKRISKQVSKTLTGSGNEDVTKVCVTCGESFTVPYKRRHRIHCSRRCGNNNTKVQDKIGATNKLIRNGVIIAKTDAEIRKQAEKNRQAERKRYDESLK